MYSMLNPRASYTSLKYLDHYTGLHTCCLYPLLFAMHSLLQLKGMLHISLQSQAEMSFICGMIYIGTMVDSLLIHEENVSIFKQTDQCIH